MRTLDAHRELRALLAVLGDDERDHAVASLARWQPALFADPALAAITGVVAISSGADTPSMAAAVERVVALADDDASRETLRARAADADHVPAALAERETTVRLRVDGAPLQLTFPEPFRLFVLLCDEIFVRRTYLVPDAAPVPVVYDLGANIGLGTLFLARRFPGARLVAVEPLPSNLRLLHKNLADNGVDAEVRPVAASARAGRTTFHRYPTRHALGSLVLGAMRAPDGSAVQAEPIEVETVPFARLLDAERYGLKIDIEGAERYVFDTSIVPSLRHVKRIAIELHDPPSREAFLRCVQASSGQLSQHGEVTLWQQEPH